MRCSLWRVDDFVHDYHVQNFNHCFEKFVILVCLEQVRKRTHFRKGAVCMKFYFG